MSYDATPPPVAAEPPPTKKQHTNAIIIGSAVLAIAGIAAVGLLINSNKNDSETASKPQPTTASSTPSPSKNLVDQMIDWRDGGGSTTIDTLSTDLHAVGEASDPLDLPALLDACSTLTADLETAQQADPIPDQATNQSWNLALTHLTASASACTAGAVSEDQADFDRMAAEMQIGIKHLQGVTKHLDEIV